MVQITSWFRPKVRLGNSGDSILISSEFHCRYVIPITANRLTYPDAGYITYEYDQLNRMTCVKNSGGTALASYTYDTRSRRTALDYVNGAGADYSYDTASRLLYVDNQTQNGQHKYAYTYDYVGNRLDMTVIDGSGTRKHMSGNVIPAKAGIRYIMSWKLGETRGKLGTDPI